MHFKKQTPNLMVEDVNRTIEFYKDMLGFNVITMVPETGQLVWAMLGREDVTMMFQARESLGEEISALRDKAIGGSLTLYTDIQGIDELYASLQGRVKIVQEMHTTFYNAREFAIEDCNGYVIAFAEPA
jgi:lactoylglutathione lyase